MSVEGRQGQRNTELDAHNADYADIRFDGPVALPPYTSHIKPDTPKDVQIAPVSLSDEMEDDLKGSGRLWDKAYTSWTDSWIAETLSCALAVIALICLIATLCYYQGRTYLLTTLPLRISLNTLVAVYSAVIKVSLLMPVAEAISQLKWLWFSRSRPIIDFEGFDLASRGPWGSFLLLFRLQSRHLAALGAWITVLALAINPLTQQIIHLFPCEQVQPNSVARVARANNFVGAGIFVAAPGSVNLDFGVSAAIYKGLLSEVSNTSSVDFVCSTGTCRFPSTPGANEAYQTLAVDYSCVDISSEARSDEVVSIAAQPNQGNGTYTLEISNSSLSVDYFHGLATNTTRGSIDRPALYSFAGLMLQTDWEKHSPNEKFQYEGIHFRPFAFSCHLWPTVQTINSYIELSSLKETVLSATPVPYGLGPEFLLVSTQVLRNGKWENCTASATFTPDTPVRIGQDKSVRLTDDRDSEGAQWYAEDCVWSMDGGTVAALWLFLDNLFQEKEIKLPYGPVDSYPSGNPWIYKLYHNSTADLAFVESYVAQLAHSITAYIRFHASHQSAGSGVESEKQAYAYGEALKIETCVQVRWAWVAFPASLVALTVIFLATTVWKFRGETNKHRAWKSSSLAVLFGGLDENAQERCGKLGTKSEMEKSAKGTNVVLLTTEDSWRLGIDEETGTK